MALLARKVFVALKRLANCTAVCSLGPATGAALMFLVEGVVLLLISDFFSTAMIDLFLALKIILTTLTIGYMAINVPNGCRPLTIVSNA